MKKGYIVIILLCITCCMGWSLYPALAAEYNQTVYDAQKLLKELGYAPGPNDGLMGIKTAAGIERFQQNNDLPVTRKLDEKTLEKLNSFRREKQPSNDKKLQEKEAPPKPLAQKLKVKGFFLGMNFKKAKENIFKVYKSIDSNFGVNFINYKNERYSCFGAITGWNKPGMWENYRELKPAHIIIKGDDNGNLISFHIPGKIVDRVFIVRGMAPDVFVKEFEKNYSIPKMKFIQLRWESIDGKTRRIDRSWKIANDEKNYSVEINYVKGIVIKTRFPFGEAKFD